METRRLYAAGDLRSQGRDAIFRKKFAVQFKQSFLKSRKWRYRKSEWKIILDKNQKIQSKTDLSEERHKPRKEKKLMH